MTNPAAPTTLRAGPLAWVGRTALDSAAYLGGVAAVPASAARALARREEVGTSGGDSVSAQLSWLFGMGLPLVAVVHVGIGSFLAMQSYFGGTFADGTGAVVGVGLLRNLAPLLAGLTLAGLVAARVTPELRARARGPKEAAGPEVSVVPRPGFLPRLSPVGREEAPGTTGGVPGRALAARLVAATVAGPVLGIWAAAVGTLVGWQVAQSLMGVSTHSFFHMFWEMLWMRDLVGVVVKGLLFGAFAGLFACHEGRRGTPDDDIASVSAAACRAACFTAVAILVVNSGWFILLYHAGPAFGPTLLEPPGL